MTCFRPSPMATSNRPTVSEPKPLPFTHRHLHGKRAFAYARRHRLNLHVESLGGWLAWDDVESRVRAGQISEDDMSVRASIQYRGYWAHFDHAASPGIYQRRQLVRHLSYEDNPRTAQMWIEGHLNGRQRTEDSLVLFLPGTAEFETLLNLSGRLN